MKIRLQIKFTYLLILTVIYLTTSLNACAGGSRGTGVRFNQDIDNSPLEEEKESDKDKNKH